MFSWLLLLEIRWKNSQQQTFFWSTVQLFHPFLKRWGCPIFGHAFRGGKRQRGAFSNFFGLALQVPRKNRWAWNRKLFARKLIKRWICDVKEDCQRVAVLFGEMKNTAIGTVKAYCRFLIYEVVDKNVSQTLRYFPEDPFSTAAMPFYFGLVLNLNKNSTGYDIERNVLQLLDNLPKGAWPSWVVSSPLMM